jgi:DNA-binding transcriptional LysR family regulator
MLKDFAKLSTFLTVVRERSFSKASAKLGISQPAVTQQIKFIEDYLDTKIVERKKNGIILTKEGDDLLRIANKLQKSVTNAEKDLLKIINKEFTFILGASFTIGNYIMPPYINSIKEKIENEVYIKVDKTDNLIDDILESKIDMALIESPNFKDGLIYREWMDDELVLFSNEPLPRTVKAEDLYNFSWICRNEDSGTRKRLAEVFESIDVECNQFDVKGIVGSATAVKETILRSPKNDGAKTVSIISRHAIRDELDEARLFETRIRNFKINRKFYIVYSKDRKHDAFIDNVVSYLSGLKS